MNANNISKVFLSVLGRNPLPETFPTLRVYLPFETAPLEYPALIAGATLSAREPRGNATATVTATFQPVLDAADFSSDEVAAMCDQIDVALCEKLTPDILNAHADDLGLPLHFYFFRWESTEEPAATSEGKLSFSFTFTGAAQF